MKEQVEVPDVPEDFPREEVLGSVSGFAPKLLLIKTEEGKFKAPKLSAEELAYRFQKCNVLAGKVSRAAVRSKAGPCAHLSEAAILEKYVLPMQRDFYATGPEAEWIVRTAAAILNWPMPESLLPKDGGAG
jgi:hypothetical protein